MPPALGEYALDFVGVCGVKRQILRLDSFLNNVVELTPQHLENFIANQMNAYGGNLDMASADIRSYTEQGRAVAVVCGSALRCQNMLDALTDTGLNVKISDLLPKGGCVNIMEGTLSAGFEYPDLGLVVMTEGQVLARRKKTQVKKSNRDKVKSYTDLTPGDLVVHEHHGIGRFIGMERMTVDGSERDFIKIAFAGHGFSVCSGNFARPHLQIHRRRRQRARAAEQARRRGLEQGESTRQSGCKGAGRGSHQAVCRARQGQGLRLPAG